MSLRFALSTRATCTPPMAGINARFLSRQGVALIFFLRMTGENALFPAPALTGKNALVRSSSGGSDQPSFDRQTFLLCI